MPLVSRIGRAPRAAAFVLFPLIGAALSTFAVAAVNIPTFTKVTAELGLDALYGSRGVYGPGVAVFDYDGDDDLDLFVPNEIDGHKLYVNDGGVFTDIAPALGLDFITELPPVADRTHPFEFDPTAMMPSFVDTDNDGDLDFFLTCWNAYNRFFENVEGVYVDRTHSSGLDIVGHSASAAWGDYDLDGLLDVYIADWGGFDHLFQNRGDNVWRDVTETSGMRNELSQPMPGWTAMWVHHSGDQFPELFVGNDYGLPNFFYFNLGGSFEDRAEQHFPELLDPERTLFDSNASMGQAFGDFDRDGDLDLFVANSLVNDLYRRDGGVYNDLMEDPVAVGPGGVASALKNNDIGWFCDWPDIDNDGWIDLFLVNGFIRLCVYDDPINPDCFGEGLPEQPNLLWMNDEGTFVKVTDEAGLTDLRWGKGGVIFDFDSDGDLDIFVTNTAADDEPGRHGFWRNDTPAQTLGNWLAIELEGRECNATAIGARVFVTANGVRHQRHRFANQGYLSQMPPVMHFGLGAATNVDEVEIIWPDGDVERYSDVAVNQRITFVENATVPTLVAPSLAATTRDGRVELRWSVDPALEWDAFLVSRHDEVGRGGHVARIESESARTDYVWTDEAVLDGSSYRYRLAAEKDGVRIEGEAAVVSLPRMRLVQVLPALPNPFNPRTKLRYRVASDAQNPRLRIVDLRGRLVRDLGPALRGVWSEVIWEGEDDHGRPVASSAYRFVVESDGASDSTPLTLVR